MDCSGELISNAIAQFLPGMLETLKEQQQQNRNQKAANVVGGMEKISLSIFSHLLFPSGMVLNPQQEWETTFPLLFCWERKEG